MSLLQNRKYTLDERLILLGIVYNKLNELKEEGKVKIYLSYLKYIIK